MNSSSGWTGDFSHGSEECPDPSWLKGHVDLKSSHHIWQGYLKSGLTLVGQACGSEEWLATHHDPDSLLACPWAL